MPSVDFTAYRESLRDMLNTVWPEIDRDAGGGGIWTVPRLQQVALEDLRGDEAITTTAIVQEVPPTFTPEWGMTNQSYVIETMFHYVRRRDMETDLEEFTLVRLSLLAEFLLYTGPAEGQCLAVTGLDVTEGNAINAILLEKNKSYFGGTVSARMLVGHGVT